MESLPLKDELPTEQKKKTAENSWHRFWAGDCHWGDDWSRNSSHTRNGLVGDSVVYLALFILRRKEPDLPRPFRAFGYPVLPAVAVIGAWIILIGYLVSNTVNSLYSIWILLLIYPAFLIVRRFLKN